MTALSPDSAAIERVVGDVRMVHPRIPDQADMAGMELERPAVVATARASQARRTVAAVGCRCAYCNHCKTSHRPIVCGVLDCRCLQFI